MNGRRNIGIGLLFIFILLIALLMLYFVVSVYIWGVHVAERELSKYSAEVLGLEERINCEYDWYNNRYLVTNELGFVLDYRRAHNTIHDESFSKQEKERMDADYEKIIKTMPEHITLPARATLWTEISAQNYEIKAQRLYLLGIYNTENLLPEYSLKKPAKIAMDVIEQLGDYYNFTGIQLVYMDKNGIFEISFPADSFVPIAFDKLLSHTQQQPSNRYYEDYKAWLAENSALWSE